MIAIAIPDSCPSFHSSGFWTAGLSLLHAVKTVSWEPGFQPNFGTTDAFAGVVSITPRGAKGGLGRSSKGCSGPICWALRVAHEAGLRVGSQMHWRRGILS